MINSETFTIRLKRILDFYNLSASSFAEKLQIPRSSVSHIMSGRNKPSLDFVLKIINEFPEVELYWLLNGKGVFPKQNKINEVTTLFSETNIIEHPIENIKTNTETNTVKKNNNNEDIERIVIFYKDGSFKNYNP